MLGHFIEGGISGPNVWSQPMLVRSADAVSVSVWGTGFGATVTLQRDLVGDGSWRDVESWTDEQVERTYLSDEQCYLRIGVKSGGYTTGTVNVRLGLKER